MYPLQWYTTALLATDAYELWRLWSASPQTLSKGSVWFDSQANAPMTVPLYAAVVAFLMLPRIFVLLEPLSRWLLLINTVHEGLRLLLCTALFSLHRDATQLNTMLLTFMLWNTFLYGRQYYTTTCMLREHSK